MCTCPLQYSKTDIIESESNSKLSINLTILG